MEHNLKLLDSLFKYSTSPFVLMFSFQTENYGIYTDDRCINLVY